MKKILSVMLVLLLCFSFGVSVFAVDSPTTGGGGGGGGGSSVTNLTTAVDNSGLIVSVSAKSLGSTNEVYKAVKTAGSAVDFVAAQGLTNAVDSAVKAYGIKTSDMKVHSVIDISVKSKSASFPLTITVAVDGVKAGDTVVFIHKASDGYEVIPGTVVSDGKVSGKFNSLSPVVVLTGKAASGALLSSYKDCSKDSSCALAAFSDLITSEWYHDGIHYCIENGLLNGVASGRFAPNMYSSRAMVVTVLWRMAGCPIVDYAVTFKDVPENEWYAEAVRWAASQGIVTGYSDAEFGPEDAFLREDFATVLYRYEKKINNGGFTGTWMFYLDYADAADISSFASEAMHWVVMNGVMNGDGGYLNPRAGLTRAQTAVMLQRFCVLSK